MGAFDGDTVPKPPVDAAETIEVFAFMEAADESKRRGGAPVSLKNVVQNARTRALARLAELDPR